MLKLGIYVDGLSIPGNTTDIRAAIIFDDSTYTPSNVIIDGTARYNLYTRGFYLIKDGDGNIIDPMYLLNNIDKFQYVNDGSISPPTGSLDDNMKLDELDETIPLTFIRANTVNNFGIL